LREEAPYIFTGLNNNHLFKKKTKIMKKIFILALAFLINSPALFAQEKAGKQDTTQHTVYYSCPMHPDVIMDKAGKCPKCGMDLVLSTKS